MDPNQGLAEDAIEAYCRMDTMETCVRPTPNTFGRQRWTSDDRVGQYFMDDMNGNKEVALSAYGVC